MRLSGVLDNIFALLLAILGGSAAILLCIWILIGAAPVVVVLICVELVCIAIVLSCAFIEDKILFVYTKHALPVLSFVNGVMNNVFR